MQFTIENKDKLSEARQGSLTTAHGIVETPIFMPVGTVGSVKAVHQTELDKDIQAQIILGNTYHLYLRPGIETLEKAGGLHQFIHWDKPMLTDSGGYQVFSLSDIRKLKEEGVEFRSHIDGSKHLFTPEKVVDIQRSIGADIVMALDECTPYPADYSYVERSMHLTHRWLDRGLAHFEKTDAKYGYFQTFFPIVQGGTFKDLRQQSAAYIAEKNCAGNAIGGLSVGEPAEKMYEMIAVVNAILPKDKPRYLMGVGTPENILEGIALGVDMFDCVMPSRNGRNGMLFTREGRINIKNEKWKHDFSPLDENGHSFVDTYYSKAYLRHLMKSEERLAAQIATIHNLAFYMDLVKTAREKIKEGTFMEWKKQTTEQTMRRL
ncbi:MAG: tRNA guanosine(34) transglycosylase Tgt [Bacteroidia bacterium]|nr:MAG: tRNA guanosine(34) transglycosylase Tgt [Bacteroidia bacterium]